MNPEIVLRNVNGWMKGAIGPPQMIEIAISRLCNLQCIFCNEHIEEALDSNELPLGEFIRLIGEAAEMEVSQISLAGGGEPFYDAQKALTVMQAIKMHGLWGSVTTNGLFSESVVKEMVEMGWDHIVVSLDGPDPESHDFMRNHRGLFERTIRTLKRFKYWKAKQKSAMPDIHINMIVANRSHTKIARMFRLAHDLGISRVNLLPLIEHTPSCKVVRMGPEHLAEFREHAPEAREVGRRLGIESNIDDLMDGQLVERQMEIDRVILADTGRNASLKGEAGKAIDPSTIPCYFPWAHLVIHASGHLKPCINKEAASFVDGRPLKEIWEKDTHLEEIRRSMFRGKLYKMCSSCCAPSVGKNRRVREVARSGEPVPK